MRKTTSKFISAVLCTAMVFTSATGTLPALADEAVDRNPAIEKEEAAGYGISGSAEISDDSTEETLPAEEPVVKETSVTELTVDYGEESFDLTGHIPEEFAAASFAVSLGDDVLSVTDGGVVSVKNAGSAVITAETEEKILDINVVVENAHIGTLSAQDVLWDDLEMDESDGGIREISGTVKNEAGVREGDVITVTATAQAVSGEPGVHDSVLSGAVFYGAENYDIEMSETGPQVTIAENSEKASMRTPAGEMQAVVTASFNDDGAVRNEKYFASDRIMTVNFSAENFEESMTGFVITCSGKEYEGTIEDIRNGMFPGVSIVSENVEADAAEYDILFGDENEDVEYAYTVDIHYGQIQASFTGDAAQDFVIDETAPSISVEYRNGDDQKVDPGSSAENTYYETSKMDVILSVKDGFFDAGNVSIDVTAEDADGNDTDAYPADSVSAVNTQAWEKEGDTAVFRMDSFDKEANYSVSAAYTDLAGNEAQPTGPAYFTIDRTSPEGTVTVTKSDGTSMPYSKVLEEKASLGFNVFDSKYVTLDSNFSDSMSGIASAQYALIDASQAGEGTYDLSSDTDSVEWKDWDGPVRVDTDKVAVILEKITDKAGHVTLLASDGAFIVDTKEPSAPVITISGEEQDVYTKDITLQVTAQDPDNGGEGVYSGIREIEWNVKNESGKVTQSGVISADGAHKKELAGTVVISSQKNSSGTVTLTVTAKDYAGNTSESSKTFAMDARAPKISSSMDMTGVKNEKYFNSTRKLTVGFNEKDYDPSKSGISVKAGGQDVSLTMKDIEDGKGEPYQIRLNKKEDSEEGKAPEEHTDKRVVSYELLFGYEDTADIDYENISFTSEDAAGNSVEHTPEASAFTVDKVKPVLTVVYTENKKDITKEIGTDAKTSRYGKLPVTISLAADERNFFADGTVLTVTAKDAENKDIKGAYADNNIADAKKDWKTSGSQNTKQLADFKNSANYSVQIAVEDKAGNRADSYAPGYFTIDAAPPEGILVVTSEEDVTEYKDARENLSFERAYGKAIELSQKSEDAVSRIEKIEYIIDDPGADTRGIFKAKTPEQLGEIGWKAWEKDKDGKYETMKIEPDGQAVVYMKVTDKSGNETIICSDGLIADATAPSLSLKGAQGASIYNSDIDMSVSAEDILSGGTFSGIVSAAVSVEKDGKETYKETFDGAQTAERLQKVSGTFKVKAAENDSNDVTIYADTADNAGNVRKTEQHVMIDTSAPEITTYMDTDDASHGRYFNNTKTMTVIFKERNFDPDNAFIQVTASGKTMTASMSELEKGLLSGIGIRAVGHTDSQAGTDIKKLTNDRTNRYEITFGSDSGSDIDYRGISFNAQDKAGNRSSHVPDMDTFTIDKVAPVIAVSYHEDGNDITGRIGTNEDVPYYSQKDITASFEIQERNFYGNGVSVSVTAKDYEGSSQDVYGEDKTGQIHAGWASDNGVSRNSLPVFSEDSNYGLSASCEDLAGNRAQEYAFHYFTIDRTPPTGQIDVYSSDENGSYDSFSASVIFRHVSSLPIRVAREASDFTSGVASIGFYRYTPPTDASEEFGALSLQDLRNVSWTQWNEDYLVDPEGQAVIYAKIMDRAGNILYINTQGAMIADSTSPQAPEITITAAEPSEGIYAGDVPVTITAQDPVSGDTYSGLRNVTVQVLNGDTVTQEYSYSPGGKADRVRTFDTSVTVDAQKNNSNFVKIRVTAQDWAGNTSGNEKDIRIDITSPRIEVVYDRNDPANGRYYNTKRTATVTVYERNFNPARVNMAITGSGNAKVSGWSIGDQAGVSDDNPNVCTIVYDEDSDYTFTMDLTDMAGNAASYGQTDSFTIDTTAPVITVTYDNNNGRGRYYNAPRTATIHVEEANFDPAAFSSEIRAMLMNEGISAPAVNGWITYGNSHTATIRFDKDGDYSFVLNLRDLAENPAQEYTSESFTIDLTNPTVGITGIRDRSANRKEAVASVEFEDINFDSEGVVITLSGLKHKEREVTGTFEALARGGKVTLPDFKHVIEEDDIYTLKVSVTDKAGNTTEKEITFSINRFGSNFYLEDGTKEYLGGYYRNTPEDLVIYEVNVNTLSSQEITVYKSGETKKLDRGQYKVEDVSEENDWKRYRYTIDGSVIEEEGVYEILISSVDEAGNRQDNKLKDTPIMLVMDKTPPAAVVTGIEDGEVYNEASREAVIQVSDNYVVTDVEVFIDGKSVGMYEAEQIAGMDYRIPVKISESTSWQTVSAKAIDAAGNEGRSEETVVLVTTSSLTRFMNSTPAKAAAGTAAAAAIVTGTVFFILGKRKKEDDED